MTSHERNPEIQKITLQEVTFIERARLSHKYTEFTFTTKHGTYRGYGKTIEEALVHAAPAEPLAPIATQTATVLAIGRGFFAKFLNNGCPKTELHFAKAKLFPANTPKELEDVVSKLSALGITPVHKKITITQEHAAAGDPSPGSPHPASL